MRRSHWFEDEEENPSLLGDFLSGEVDELDEDWDEEDDWDDDDDWEDGGAEESWDDDGDDFL